MYLFGIWTIYWTHFFFKPWPYSQILQVLCQIKATSDPNSSFFEGRGRTNLVNTDFLKAQSEEWFPGEYPTRPVLGRRGNVCDHLGLVSCPHGSSSRYSGQVVMITTEISLSALLLIWLARLLIHRRRFRQSLTVCLAPTAFQKCKTNLFCPTQR